MAPSETGQGNIGKSVASDRPGEAFPLRAQPFAFIVNSADRLLEPFQAFPGGIDLRAHPFASLFAASLILLAPVHAVAQEPDDSVSVRERARPDYDPLGLRFGGFDLNASLDFGVASTDNLFAAETGEQDDMVFRVSPSARLASHWSRHALSVEAGATFKSHDDFSSEDADTGYLAAAGRLDVGSNTNIFGRASLAQDVESRADPDALTFNEPVEYERNEIAIGAQHTFNRWRLRGTYAQVEYDYDDAGGFDQDFRDSDETSFTGRVEAELTPRVAAVFEARFDERDYDNAPALNSEGETYLAGVAINFTDLMRGELTVGQFNRDYDFGLDVDGLAVNGNLEWYITRLTTITFNGSRGARDMGATTAIPFVESEYGVRVDHELLRNVILSAGLHTGRRDYELIDREDEYTGFDLGVEYLVNRRLALRAGYNYDETDSNGVNRYRDFEQNVLSLGVSLRL